LTEQMQRTSWGKRQCGWRFWRRQQGGSSDEPATQTHNHCSRSMRTQRVACVRVPCSSLCHVHIVHHSSSHLHSRLNDVNSRRLCCCCKATRDSSVKD
jgi:hypothetical protein